MSLKSRERGGKHTLDESSVQTNFQTRARFAGFRLRAPAPCHLHASTSSLHRQACRTAGFVTKSGDRPLSAQGETIERPCWRARSGVPASCCPSHVPNPPPETADRSRALRAALTTISQVLLLQQNETIYSETSRGLGNEPGESRFKARGKMGNPGRQRIPDLQSPGSISKHTYTCRTCSGAHVCKGTHTPTHTVLHPSSCPTPSCRLIPTLWVLPEAGGWSVCVVSFCSRWKPSGQSRGTSSSSCSPGLSS